MPRAGLLGDGEDLFRWHVEKLGVWFDEAPDEPRAGDAIDLKTFARACVMPSFLD